MLSTKTILGWYIKRDILKIIRNEAYCNEELHLKAPIYNFISIVPLKPHQPLAYFSCRDWRPQLLYEDDFLYKVFAILQELICSAPVFNLGTTYPKWKLFLVGLWYWVSKKNVVLLNFMSTTRVGRYFWTAV